MSASTVTARWHVVDDTLLLFATPVHQLFVEEPAAINAALRERILAMRAASPGRTRSNEGGWHSDGNLLLQLGEPLGRQLSGLFMRGVRGALAALVDIDGRADAPGTIDAWANVNERGHANALHIHPGCSWSGVYYVAAEPESAGEIYFLDPRTEALMSVQAHSPYAVNNRPHVTPVPGMLLVFPSFLYHGVYPYAGDGPRISIAFNLKG
jgi:uncharacterized protein (TIGR02466 family)